MREGGWGRDVVCEGGMWCAVKCVPDSSFARLAPTRRMSVVPIALYFNPQPLYIPLSFHSPKQHLDLSPHRNQHPPPPVRREAQDGDAQDAHGAQQASQSHRE